MFSLRWWKHQVETNVAVARVLRMPEYYRGHKQPGIMLSWFLSLECEIAPTRLFALKNYFNPDLPKGKQIPNTKTPGG
jgi:Asp-tRNA(Asn)/Glu-tRNA(Gln) amidotransferase B subunit